VGSAPGRPPRRRVALTDSSRLRRQDQATDRPRKPGSGCRLVRAHRRHRRFPGPTEWRTPRCLRRTRPVSVVRPALTPAVIGGRPADASRAGVEGWHAPRWSSGGASPPAGRGCSREYPGPGTGVSGTQVKTLLAVAARVGCRTGRGGIRERAGRSAGTAGGTLPGGAVRSRATARGLVDFAEPLPANVGAGAQVPMVLDRGPCVAYRRRRASWMRRSRGPDRWEVRHFLRVVAPRGARQEAVMLDALGRPFRPLFSRPLTSLPHSLWLCGRDYSASHRPARRGENRGASGMADTARSASRPARHPRAARAPAGGGGPDTRAGCGSSHGAGPAARLAPSNSQRLTGRRLSWPPNRN
jgi:hypothetical protein